MRVRKIKNTSGKAILVEHGNGVVTTLPADAELENVKITNLNELRGKAAITEDLGEVNVYPDKHRLLD